MILHCLRHGTTAANLAHRFNPEDDPLDEASVRALRAVTFASDGYDRVYVSPLVRAVQTAHQITERGLGVFRGLTAAECAARHAEAFAAFSRFEAEPAIPEGESRGEHLARVAAWLEEAAAGAAERVLAITHGGVIDFIYRMAVGHSMHGGDDIFGGENLGLSAFEVSWPEVRLLAFSTELAGTTGGR